MRWEMNPRLEGGDSMVNRLLPNTIARQKVILTWRYSCPSDRDTLLVSLISAQARHQV